MKRYWAYAKKVLLHKYYVFLACIKLRVPLYLAVLHDLSKFGKEEFVPYAKHFYDNDGKSKNIKNIDGSYDPSKQHDNFRFAWIHHKNHNKHHSEYWIIVGSDASLNPLPIPDKYLKEMVADWIGAGRAYQNKTTPMQWYEEQKIHMILHEETRKKVEQTLKDL
jgi:hypothetical protein